MIEEQTPPADRAKVPDEKELIFHLSEMVGCEVRAGLVAVLTGEPPLPDIAGCLLIWPKKKEMEAEIAKMERMMGIAKSAFDALADAQDQWDEFDRFAPEFEEHADARKRVGNLPMALGVSQTATIANLRWYQTCMARLEGLNDQRSYHPSTKGRPPNDVRADHIAKEVAIFFARHTGSLPNPPFVHSGNIPSGKYAIALDTILGLCGLDFTHLKGPAERGVRLAKNEDIKWIWGGISSL